jgi:hypothetical protein
MTKRNPEVEKVCVVCEKRFTTSIGPKQTCSPECNKANGKRLSKEWVLDNTEKVNKRAQEWRDKNLEKSRLASRKSAAKLRRDNPRVVKHRKLKSSYGITLDEYENMLQLQNNKCAICFFEFVYTSQSKGPHVDHDHETGKVRMILCRFCNNLLGYANDDTLILENAITYLDKYNDK